MLTREDSVLVVIDVQGKLAQLMYGKETLFKNLQIMIQGARVLEIPIIWLEQIPENLGPTTPEIAGLLTDLCPIRKHTFSAWGNREFQEAFRAINRNQVLVTGIETHICVYQTALDLLALGNEVHILTDAVASRIPTNKTIGLEKIRAAGGIPTSVETALFEILREANGPGFKEIIRLIK